MIKNYFIVAFRNLKRNKLFSLINIGGLAIGLAACWMIALYVANETSYDNYHTRAARIYRVAQHGSWSGGNFNLAVTPPPMAAALKNEYPEIEQTVRFDAEGGGAVTYGEQRLQVGDMLFADSSVFNVFSYHFLYGDARTALNRPQSIVLTQTLAKNYLGMFPPHWTKPSSSETMMATRLRLLLTMYRSILILPSALCGICLHKPVVHGAILPSIHMSY